MVTGRLLVNVLWGVTLLQSSMQKTNANHDSWNNWACSSTLKSMVQSSAGTWCWPLPEGFYPSRSNKFKKETDIMDVWFDSGSSWNGLWLTVRTCHPADLPRRFTRPPWLVQLISDHFCGEPWCSNYKQTLSLLFCFMGKVRRCLNLLEINYCSKRCWKAIGAEILRLATSVDLAMTCVSMDILSQCLRLPKIRNTLRFFGLPTLRL